MNTDDISSSALPRPHATELTSFVGATAWLNTDPLTSESLKGKVVLVSFWTYTCVNWLRTLPYLRAWSHRYADDGLVVVGVHTPEFEFERDLDNVRRNARQLGIEYPIAVDNDYAIWDGFDNSYWPALYVIDSTGRIRHHQFGEGSYETAEFLLRQLLQEAAPRLFPGPLTPINVREIELEADWTSLKSPETYLGADRASAFSHVGPSPIGQPHTFDPPEHLRLNHWALRGEWTVEADSIEVDVHGSSILIECHARDVNLVMGMSAPEIEGRFRVLFDGDIPASARGLDVDTSGRGVVGAPRLYQLIRQPGEVTEHTIEIQFLDAGARAYVFTFG
jgi:thiol-disulfide isomerase/thioredoxin